MTYDAEAIIDYDYAAHKDQYRMPLNERASIFLPFAALAGFDEEIQKVINQHITSMKQRQPQRRLSQMGLKVKKQRNQRLYTTNYI